MKTISVNLIGAPGSGKSALALSLAGYLKRKGINCEYIPEFAKQLVYEKKFTALQDQFYVFTNQLRAMNIPKNNAEVLICDSPLYLSSYYNKKLIKANKRTISQKEIENLIKDSTSKFENINYFIIRNHPYQKIGRVESEEEAIQAEKDIMESIKELDVDFEILKSTDDCVNIIAQRIIKKMEEQNKIGNKNQKEIERKFLVKKLPEEYKKAKKLDLFQGYLKITDNEEERIRSIDNEIFYHTIKKGSGLEREEIEEEIEEETFKELRQKVEGRFIYKDRYKIPLKSSKLVAELDIYKHAYHGLYTVEVEFPSEEEAEKFVPPEWFGEEVTKNSYYKNKDLALKAAMYRQDRFDVKLLDEELEIEG